MNLEKLIKSFEPYRDRWGAIVQRDGDGGDSCYRTSLLIALLYLAGNKLSAKYQLELWQYNFQTWPGIFRRHPDKTKWYSRPNNFSRDQFEKAWLMLLIVSPLKVFPALFWQMLRLGFHQNIHKGTDCNGLACYKLPDLPGVGQVRAFVRTFFGGLWCLTGVVLYSQPLVWLFAPYLLLCLMDLAFVADLHFRKKQTWDYDSLMAIDLAYANFRMPTPVSVWAGREYLKTDWKERILHNYGATENDIKPLGGLYVETVEAILNRKEKANATTNQ